MRRRRSAASLCGVVTEQAREELQVLLDGERRIQVLAQPLRHVGDARADEVAVRFACHVAAERFDGARLHGTRACDEREQRRFADTVRPDQPDHAVRRDVDGDAIERDRLAAVLERDVHDMNNRRCAVPGRVSAVLW